MHWCSICLGWLRSYFFICITTRVYLRNANAEIYSFGIAENLPQSKRTHQWKDNKHDYKLQIPMVKGNSNTNPSKQHLYKYAWWLERFILAFTPTRIIPSNINRGRWGAIHTTLGRIGLSIPTSWVALVSINPFCIFDEMTTTTLLLVLLCLLCAGMECVRAQGESDDDNLKFGCSGCLPTYTSQPQ